MRAEPGSCASQLPGVENMQAPRWARYVAGLRRARLNSWIWYSMAASRRGEAKRRVFSNCDVVGTTQPIHTLLIDKLSAGPVKKARRQRPGERWHSVVSISNTTGFRAIQTIAHGSIVADWLRLVLPVTSVAQRTVHP